MLRRIKEFAKSSLPYPVFLRLWYAWYFARRWPHAVRARRRAGLPRLDTIDLSSYKSSDTLFILGGGASINRIPPERWQAIAANDTVGTNFWLIHPFVPKFYFLEVITREAHPNEFARFVAIANRRATDYAKTVKVAMELDKHGTQTLTEFSLEFRHNLFAAYNRAVPARTEAELAQAFEYLAARGCFARGGRFPFLLKYNATLTTLLVFALRLGYKRVVLCGIDLKNQEYFFHDRALYPEWNDLEYQPRDTRHDTDIRLPWRVPVSQVVGQMKQQFFDPAGVELYVENRGSALWPTVPEAPETIFQAASSVASHR